MELPM